jgi:FixJ family two-component response regulator
MDALGEREREVLELLVLGHTNVAIASLMFLSPRTIETGQHPAQARREEPRGSRPLRLSAAARSDDGTARPLTRP